MLDAQRAEEGANLSRKQALIARAQEIANKAGEGTWGKAIGEIKDLQTQWKEIGYVPRRDADTVWKAFRAACDSLFTKRDQARDSEANAHRAQIATIKDEIYAVIGGGDDVVNRAIAVRTKATELGVLGDEVVAMVQHVIATHGDAVKGTELDPAQLRTKRDKLIARAEELLPKEKPAVAGTVDLAAQLKQAMQKNAFGDLRFSGRDPVEVIDELRSSWAEIGPILDEADRAQVARFDDVVAKVLDAAGVKAKAEREDSTIGAEPRERRRRGERAAHQPPVVSQAPRSTEPNAISEIVATQLAVPHASRSPRTTPSHSPRTCRPSCRSARSRARSRCRRCRRSTRSIPAGTWATTIRLLGRPRSPRRSRRRPRPRWPAMAPSRATVSIRWTDASAPARLASRPRRRRSRLRRVPRFRAAR
jgi:hypothetical protein